MERREFIGGLVAGVGLLSLPAPARGARGGRGVRLVRDDAARRVDVFVEGRPFTSYVWPESLMKPVLYPLRAASGALVTRGFPLDPRPFERADHPHQVGSWLNFGDVNGADFWNNSTARTPAEKSRMGAIRHRRVVSTKGGGDRGELVVEADWLMPDGSHALAERTRFVFRAPSADARAFDRVTTLAAHARPVVFRDNKEGFFAVRVARQLEQPNEVRDVFLDAEGKPAAGRVVNNEGATGRYLTSEGLAGDDAFGTPGRWCALAGRVGGEPVTVAIFDHPSNPNYPARWFARGYGLFAANPFGRRAYSVERREPPEPESSFTLRPRSSLTLRYRLLVVSGAEVAPAELDAEHRRFAAGVK